MARNNLMQMWMEKHSDKAFDWIFHIDSDTVFRPDQFLRLLQDAIANHITLLSGIYMQKKSLEGERQPVIMRKINEKYEYIKTELKQIINSVDAVGLGFLICKPEVYIKLKNKYGKFVFEYENNGDEMLSEDIVWCKRAKEAGYGVYVDKNVVVGHYGVI